MKSLIDFINENIKQYMQYPLEAVVRAAYFIDDPIESSKAKQDMQRNFDLDEFKNFDEFYKFCLDNADVITQWRVDNEGPSECEVVGTVAGKELRFVFSDYDEHNYSSCEDYFIDAVDAKIH